MNIYAIVGVVVILTVPAVAQARISSDTDGDGLSNSVEEMVFFTDPYRADTDGDGHDDGDEIRANYSPRHGEGKRLIQVDSDNDHLNDAWEIILGTGLMNPDTDGDLFLDGTEVAASFDPLSPEPVRLEKLIKVDLAAQSLEYFFDGKKLDSFPVSTGLRYTPTPPGEYEVLTKRPIVDYGGADYWYPGTKWNLHFLTQRGRFYIHGAWWHDNFGQPMSHGCVNVRYDNMEQLYWFAQLGTKIVIE